MDVGDGRVPIWVSFVECVFHFFHCICKPGVTVPDGQYARVEASKSSICITEQSQPVVPAIIHLHESPLVHYSSQHEDWIE